MLTHFCNSAQKKTRFQINFYLQNYFISKRQLLHRLITDRFLHEIMLNLASRDNSVDRLSAYSSLGGVNYRTILYRVTHKE